ncbi:DNA-binding response regulator [Schaedlerella arabinosiphila]|jgi:DNA-binding response OmpR family regulator|uniref:DNA-binding response regulator n=1 Tax=Schaedlerella arabinosiphila TaxID=2044587 RepID=A0A426DN10_9FIRM|nr:response regulator transcription factor [Schaedlerella arabinosiphila]RRK34061.1 DNA-binding response regulator [Schaedlerella arabinosiphila]
MRDVIKVLIIIGNSEILHEMITFLKEKSQYQSMNLSMPSNILSFSGLEIHLREQTVYLHHKSVPMTYYEFKALCFFVQHPKWVLTKKQIYEAVYHCGILEDIDNIVYCLIHNLRNKIEIDPRHPEYIHTVRGIGYKFEVKKK